jgi:hypothetical protein
MGLRPGFQAEIWPLRLAKMKSADAPSPRMKDEAFELATCPVGPWGPTLVVGMVTVRICLTAVVAPVTA